MKRYLVFILIFLFICGNYIFTQEEEIDEEELTKRKADTESAIKVIRKIKTELDTMQNGYNLEFMMQSQAEDGMKVITLEGTGTERMSQYQQKMGYYKINKIMIGNTNMKPKKKDDLFAEIYQNNQNFAILINLPLDFRTKTFLSEKDAPPKRWMELFDIRKEVEFNYRVIFISLERIFDYILRATDYAKILSDVEKIKLSEKDKKEIRVRKIVVKLNDTISDDIKNKLEIPLKATSLAEEVVKSDYGAEIFYEELSSSDNIEKSQRGKIIRLDFYFIQHVDFKTFQEEKGLTKKVVKKEEEEDEIDPWKMRPRNPDADDEQGSGSLFGTDPQAEREGPENPNMSIQKISLDGYFIFKDHNNGEQFELPKDDEARKILRY